MNVLTQAGERTISSRLRIPPKADEDEERGFEGDGDRESGGEGSLLPDSSS